MELARGKGQVLSLKVYTWYKDSHSLFDYESNKINNNNFSFPVAAKSIALYRKRDCNPSLTQRATSWQSRQVKTPTSTRKSTNCSPTSISNPQHSNSFG